MSDYHKLLNHPDRDQIISRLTAGEPVREVARWLKQKYPNNKYNQASFAFLDRFRRNYLNIHGTILEDLKTKIQEQQHEEMNEHIKQVVKKNKTYSEKLEEIVDTQIDWKKRLNQYLNIVETRFAALFDMAQENPKSLKPDRAMIDWMRNMLEMVREIRKVEGAPDQIIQHNVAITAVDEKVSILQQAVIMTLSELPIQTSSYLIDKLHENLKQVEEDMKNGGSIFGVDNIKKIETIAAKILPMSDITEDSEDYKNE